MCLAAPLCSGPRFGGSSGVLACVPFSREKAFGTYFSAPCPILALSPLGPWHPSEQVEAGPQAGHLRAGPLRRVPVLLDHDRV